MDAFRISAKFFVEDASRLDVREFVPIFHSWIQNHAVPEHLLVDVADYAHVHEGPGVVLIAHEANFYMDQAQGRLGLMYSRKHPAAGSFQDRVRQAVFAASDACTRLEEDPLLAGRIHFPLTEAILRVHDRLHAPNTLETFEQLRPELQKVFGPNAKIEHRPSPLKLFEVRVTAANALPIEMFSTSS
jgi:hypothetical protein